MTPAFLGLLIWAATVAGIYFLIERRLEKVFLLAAWSGMGIVCLVLIVRLLLS